MHARHARFLSAGLLVLALPLAALASEVKDFAAAKAAAASSKKSILIDFSSPT